MPAIIAKFSIILRFYKEDVRQEQPPALGRALVRGGEAARQLGHLDVDLFRSAAQRVVERAPMTCELDSAVNDTGTHRQRHILRGLSRLGRVDLCYRCLRRGNAIGRTVHGSVPVFTRGPSTSPSTPVAADRGHRSSLRGPFGGGRFLPTPITAITFSAQALATLTRPGRRWFLLSGNSRRSGWLRDLDCREG